MATWLQTRLRENAESEQPLTATLDRRSLRRIQVLLVVVMVLGAVGLSFSLRIPPGDPLFHPATILVAAWWLLWALALTWLHGRSLGAPEQPSTPASRRRQLGVGALSGAVLLGIFLLGALVVSLIPVLREPAEQLLAHAGGGALPVVAAITAVSGVCEEAFFRGPVYAGLLGHSSVIWSSVAYALVTAVSGIWLLALAALLLGLVCGVLRRLYGHLWAAVSCHLVWSLGMLFFLAPVLHSSVLEHWRF